MNLDLINWLDGIIAEVKYGTHTFIILYRAGWTGYEVENLLRKYGVYVYGRLYNELSPDEQHYGFRVAKHQANYAEYLLFRACVPVTSPIFNPKNEKYRAMIPNHASLPPGGWGRKSKGITNIMHFLAVFAGVPVKSINHEIKIEKRARVNPAKRGMQNGKYDKGRQ